MKSVAWIAAVLLSTVACEKSPSRLDQLNGATSGMPKGGGGGGDTAVLEARIAKLEKLLGTRQEALTFLDSLYEQQRGNATGSSVPGVDMARVARMEKMLADREEALAFLDMAYEQQVEAQTKPEPGVVYGVDITQNLANNQFEGPRDAMITIVEAWDYA